MKSLSRAMKSLSRAMKSLSRASRAHHSIAQLRLEAKATSTHTFILLSSTTISSTTSL
jgi:hypothetical protein